MRNRPAEIPTFSPPTLDKNAKDWPLEAAEVICLEQAGLEKAKCPKCQKAKPKSEMILWPDPEQVYTPRFLCSGCRSDIGRREDTLYKDEMLVILKHCGVDVPDKLIQWMRVQCKIAEHPGSPTLKPDIDIEASMRQNKLVFKMIEGGRTGARAGIGIVD